MSTKPPGFYRRPGYPGRERWWTGSQWSETYRDVPAQDDHPAVIAWDTLVNDETPADFRHMFGLGFAAGAGWLKTSKEDPNG